MSRVRFAALFLALSACNSTSRPPNLGALCGAPKASASAVSDVESGNAGFAVSLFQSVADGGTNLVLSPYSVSTALDLTYAGAANGTATQMAQVLGLGSAASNAGPAVAAVGCQVETDGSNDGNHFSIANALYGQTGFTFVPAFLDTLRTDYGAPLQTVDFSNASAAVGTIDAWVSTQTDAMIPSLLQASDVDADTRLVLVNALYFKGTWANGFDSSKTQNAPFYVDQSGNQVSAPMMTQSSKASFGYVSTGGVAIAELPYQGGDIVLDIVLPNDPSTLTSLIDGLTAAQLQGWLANLTSTALATLSIPRFKVDSHVQLASALENLGLTLPFDSTQADFSAMSTVQPLHIERVVHEAVIEVDESGTTAAAATAVVVSDHNGEVVGPPSFIANHPFAFVLRDPHTGTLLFVGQVLDPTK